MGAPVTVNLPLDGGAVYRGDPYPPGNATLRVHLSGPGFVYDPATDTFRAQAKRRAKDATGHEAEITVVENGPGDIDLYLRWPGDLTAQWADSMVSDIQHYRDGEPFRTWVRFEITSQGDVTR